MKSPTYINVPSPGGDCIVETKTLGNGTMLVDYNAPGEVVGVEFIPSEPLPVVQESDLIDGEWYWVVSRTMGVEWFPAQWDSSVGECWGGREIRGPIPKPEAIA